MMDITVYIDGKPLRVYYQEERFIHEVIERGEYETAFKDLVILDLGCNIGTFSFSVYNRAEMIYAVDLSQECLDLMNKTIEENKLDRIKTYCIGITGTGGERQFITDDQPGSGAWRLAQDQRTPLPTTTIDAFMNENDIKVVDLMKIDVEGSEFEIFESEGFKQVASRIHKIVGEYHHRTPEKELEAAGYIFKDLDYGHFIAKKI